ncbi:hypothetical protein BJV82DRAFT_180450 [Fennellomyces sp. T-0311]|nr:hypothetical protein BJV82DRAFT_180450 [Fennellomyces sp. T-0311]
MTKTSLNSLHEQLPQAAIDDGDLPSGHESDKHTLYAQLGQCLTLSDCQTTAHRPTTDLAMEIRNAEELIQSTPGLPTGYIRAGELYSLLGYQQRAMSLYMDGLNNTNSEYHGVLQRQYEAAKTKDEKRIDILTVVPYDVVVDIVNYLATKEHLVLLNVSKAWRDILSGHSSIWRNIAISDSDTLSVAEISRVARFGSHTLDFTLSRMSMKFGEALLYQLSKGSFNSLVHLGLYMY